MCTSARSGQKQVLTSSTCGFSLACVSVVVFGDGKVGVVGYEEDARYS